MRHAFFVFFFCSLFANSYYCFIASITPVKLFLKRKGTIKRNTSLYRLCLFYIDYLSSKYYSNFMIWLVVYAIYFNLNPRLSETLIIFFRYASDVIFIPECGFCIVYTSFACSVILVACITIFPFCTSMTNLGNPF